MYKGRRAIFNEISGKTGQIAILVDPEKTKEEEIIVRLVQKAEFAGVNYFLVGGSTVSAKDLKQCIALLKQHTQLPVILFPGASHQISDDADALFFLNLISGRNPDYLIGHHIAAASELQEMNLEIIPTAYVLVDGGKQTSVQYVSQTTPIPGEQFSIARNTVLAGMMLGLQLIYFDAGSGAYNLVPTDWIYKLRKEIQVPIIVGGGIKSIETIDKFKEAGVNLIVIGNHIEENIDFLLDIGNYNREVKKA